MRGIGKDLQLSSQTVSRALWQHDADRREVQAAAKLSHPNIVAAWDAEQAGDLHLLVMEFVDGTDVATIVQQQGPLDVEQACSSIAQAASGLQHAYDDERVYRCWYFPTGSHKPLVVTSQWNAADTSFSGKADLGNGVTMTTSHRFVGTDTFEFSATVKDAAGTVLNLLSGTRKRQPARQF